MDVDGDVPVQVGHQAVQTIGVIPVAVGQQDFFKVVAALLGELSNALALIAGIDDDALFGCLIGHQIAVGCHRAHGKGFDKHRVWVLHSFLLTGIGSAVAGGYLL